jgi:starch synthase
MEILHITAECYPYAKAGGLGDVAGALPKYQQQLGHVAKVVLPMHRTKFLYQNEWEVVHKGNIGLADWRMDYTIIKEKTNKLGFDLYCVDINGLLDRENIYSYDDDTERFLAFQIAVVDWLSQWQHRPDVVHVHDHHTALVPFMMQHTYAYQHLAGIPTLLTIHNAQYQGWMDWSKSNLLPAWDSWKWGLLDWNRMINPLASGVKCAKKVNTVSPSYMEEVRYNANGLEMLFEYERGKCLGIINGIDNEAWDPEKDPALVKNFDAETATAGKKANKEQLCKQFGLQPQKPLFVFIGRLVGEKAADILPEAIERSLYQYDGAMNFLILGSGDPNVENQLSALSGRFAGYYNARIAYNETLSHQMYAGADFLLMPSRVEPCGLNQMYAMRYGTMPLVRSTGGLKDTVIDIGDGGTGIRFNNASADDLVYSVGRASGLFYHEPDLLEALRIRMMGFDFSWEKSAQTYLDSYNNL